MALRERFRARLANDDVGESRARKSFRLVPMLLLHRPRHSGSVGGDGLAQRAEDFARGKWINLIQAVRQIAAGDDNVRRVVAADSCAEGAGVQGQTRVDRCALRTQDQSDQGGAAGSEGTVFWDKFPMRRTFLRVWGAPNGIIGPSNDSPNIRSHGVFPSAGRSWTFRR